MYFDTTCNSWKTDFNKIQDWLKGLTDIKSRKVAYFQILGVSRMAPDVKKCFPKLSSVFICVNPYVQVFREYIMFHCNFTAVHTMIGNNSDYTEGQR